MIVEEPPYDLVVLFADADAQEFFKTLVERGPRQGCMRAIRWRPLRDPRRDASTWRNAAGTLGPFISGGAKLVVIWDHEGSGREDRAPEDVERDVKVSLVAAGAIEQAIEAVALVPELEGVLVPAWDRVVGLLAEQRERPVPQEEALLRRLRANLGQNAPEAIEVALRTRPKELLEAVVDLLQLRLHPKLYGRLANGLSLPRIKLGATAKRLSERLEEWFPPAWGTHHRVTSDPAPSS
jgi:hypothetical protein